jgi:hypothetical protein
VALYEGSDLMTATHGRPIGHLRWHLVPRATRRDDRDAAQMMAAREQMARARAQHRLQMARKIVAAIGGASANGARAPGREAQELSPWQGDAST